MKHYFYPAILSPPPTLSFADQFAFRPGGSTTAALIALLRSITTMLRTNPYVVVITLDFSKAFDTVRHSTFAEKLASLDMPDCVYNWGYLHSSPDIHIELCWQETNRVSNSSRPASSRDPDLGRHRTTWPHPTFTQSQRGMKCSNSRTIPILSSQPEISIVVQLKFSMFRLGQQEII